jgi:hypothetical protein
MKPETKIAIWRWTIRKLRLLFDLLDDRLHAAEVRLRDELSVPVQMEPSRTSGAQRETVSRVGSVETDELLRDRVRGRLSSGDQPQRAAKAETFIAWEARRSGVAPVSKKSSRRRGMPARAFDLRFTS